MTVRPLGHVVGKHRSARSSMSSASLVTYLRTPAVKCNVDRCYPGPRKLRVNRSSETTVGAQCAGYNLSLHFREFRAVNRFAEEEKDTCSVFKVRQCKSLTFILLFPKTRSKLRVKGPIFGSVTIQLMPRQSGRADALMETALLECEGSSDLSCI